MPERQPDKPNIEPDKPNASFGNSVRSADEPTKLSSKYPRTNAILSENPTISVRNLAEQLGVSNDTAHRVKKEWEADNNKEASDNATQETGSGFKLPRFKGNTLSNKEAEELADSFMEALEGDFHAIDEYLWHRQLAAGIDTNNQPVWTNMDGEEIAKITKVMMRWGQHNATIAAIDRGIIESGDYIAVGTIMVPRARETVKIYRETRIARSRRTNENIR